MAVRDAANYRDALLALLPAGQAWPRDLDTRLAALLYGQAEELARIDARGLDLIEESDPRTTTELIGEWEAEYGLPDACTAKLPDTLAARRTALWQKVLLIGGQNRQLYINLAAAAGYVVTIEEFEPVRAGIGRAGDALTNGDWTYTFRVYGPSVEVTPLTAGGSAGSRLRDWGIPALECPIRRYKPAHTQVLFAYTPYGGLLQAANHLLDVVQDYLYPLAHYHLPEALN